MTQEEILQAVTADPALAVLVPDVAAITAAMSLNRKKLTATEIGNGVILETLGLTAGNVVLDLINTTETYKYVKPLLETGRLRLDSSLVRTTIQSLVPAVLTQLQADSLLDLALVPDPLTEIEVARAILNNDGTPRI